MQSQSAGAWQRWVIQIAPSAYSWYTCRCHEGFSSYKRQQKSAHPVALGQCPTAPSVDSLLHAESDIRLSSLIYSLSTDVVNFSFFLCYPWNFCRDELHNVTFTTPYTGGVRVESQKTSGYCWRISFKVLEVLFFA